MLAFKMVDTRLFMVGFCALAVLSQGVVPVAAKDAQLAAMFPFELVIERQMDGGLAPPTANEEEKKRLLLLDKKLQELLVSSGKYSRVDLSQFTKKIYEASPVHDCNGCDLDLAKEAGAEISVVGVVRKSTSTLLSISIFLREVSSGKLLKAGVVSIRENNDAGWLRAVRSIVRNRILGRSQR